MGQLEQKYNQAQQDILKLTEATKQTEKQLRAVRREKESLHCVSLSSAAFMLRVFFWFSCDSLLLTSWEPCRTLSTGKFWCR